MKTPLAIASLWSAFCANVQAGEIYDVAGNLVFHTEDTGRTIEVTGLEGVRAYRETVLIDHKTGKVYAFDHRWDQVTVNGEVVMDYNFNRRQWRWVEGRGVQTGGRVNADLVRRIYTQETPRDVRNNYVENAFVYKAEDHGDIPILSYSNGIYQNEFGEQAYSLKPGTGGFPGWAAIIMVHEYFLQTYESGNDEELARKRQVVADQFGNSHSIALDMLALGHHYETVEMRMFGGHYRMIYFAEIAGQIVDLNKTQVARLKNKWLILNKKLMRSTTPFAMPAGGHNLERKKAERRGVQGLRSGDLVFEIKIRPEYVAEFRAEMFGGADGASVIEYEFEAANY